VLARFISSKTKINKIDLNVIKYSVLERVPLNPCNLLTFDFK